MTDPNLPRADVSAPEPVDRPPQPPSIPRPDDDLPPERTGDGRLRRYVAALLSAFVPGLGHLALGHRRLAAFFLVPVVTLVGAAAVIVAVNDRTGLAARLVDPAVLAWLLVLQLVVLAWRLLALGSSLLLSRQPRYSSVDVVPIALILVFVLAPQAYLADLTTAARDASNEVFSGDGDSSFVWHPSFSPSPSPESSTDPALPTPSPTPVPLGKRTTVLLIGEDSGPNRQTALTDTMIMASLDPVARTVSMLSIPRDLVDAPIPGGGVFHPKINSLEAYARMNPAAFPGSQGHGEAVLAAVLGELIGVQVDYWAKVNLPGMFRLVDRVGGIDVNVARGFCDPQYIQYGQRSFGVIAGRWHLDGSQALAFARIRKPNGESDFTRAARQQEVLIALRDAIVRGGFLADPIGFVQDVGAAVSTNVPPSVIPSVAEYADEIPRDHVFRGVVTYPLVHDSATADSRGAILLPDIPAIRAAAAQLFPAVGTMPVVTSAASGAYAGAAPPPDLGGAKASAAPGASGDYVPSADATVGPVVEGRAPNLPRITCKYVPPKATPAPSPSSQASPSVGPSSSDGLPSGEPSPGEATPVPSGEPTPPAHVTPAPTSDVTPRPTAEPSPAAPS